MDTLVAASAMLRTAHRPVIFTGAGMSVDSGVPVFRGAQDGLWGEFDPQRLATPAAYRADRDLVWGWYVWRMALVARAQPHAGHLALADLQARWSELAIVTQNADDQHERAGSRHAAEAGRRLSGREYRGRCSHRPRCTLNAATAASSETAASPSPEPGDPTALRGRSSSRRWRRHPGR